MRYYYIKDYQGNNRVVLDQNGVVKQINHYYPYGSLMGEGYNASSQPYRYGGKELVTLGGFDLSDFDARWLDSPSGSFTTMDPLCEKFYATSPYIYCAANPIKYIDPTGMDWITANYNNHTFYFYDERVRSDTDIHKYYSNDATAITYIGKTDLIIYPNLSIGLLSDGTFFVNSFSQNKEYDQNGILIGSTNYTSIKSINNNFYGSYLGSLNPTDKYGLASYASPPINKDDYYAFLHDREYDEHNAIGATDALLNYKVLDADIKLSYRLATNMEYISLRGTTWRIGASILFSNVYKLKLRPTFMLYYWLK